MFPSPCDILECGDSLIPFPCSSFPSPPPLHLFLSLFSPPSLLLLPLPPSPQLTAGHDGDVVSQYVCLLHGVGGHHSHTLLLLPQDQVPDVSTNPWIHSSCRLICSVVKSTTTRHSFSYSSIPILTTPTLQFHSLSSLRLPMVLPFPFSHSLMPPVPIHLSPRNMISGSPRKLRATLSLLFIPPLNVFTL